MSWSVSGGGYCIGMRNNILNFWILDLLSKVTKIYMKYMKITILQIIFDKYYTHM